MAGSCPDDGRRRSGSASRCGCSPATRPTAPRRSCRGRRRSATSTTSTRCARFAEGCDVLTFDHEHVPTEHLRALQADGRRRAARPRRARARPGQGAHARAADRARRARARAGRRCRRVAELAAFGDEVGWPVVVKTPRGGYDGKGVRVVAGAGRGAPTGSTAGVPLLAEEKVPFTPRARRRWSRAARTARRRAWPVVETMQVDGVCREVVAPAPVARTTRSPRSRPPCGSPDGLGVTGVLAVELFDTADGRAGQRARDAAAQQRALDDRRPRDQPVRAAPARRARPAARRHRDDARRRR